jgi:phosphate transporter
MIGQERRGEIGDGQIKAFGESPHKELGPALIDFRTRWGRVRINKRWVFSITAVSIFTALLLNPVLDRPEPSNCFAILCFATILWATEVNTHPNMAH